MQEWINKNFYNESGNLGLSFKEIAYFIATSFRIYFLATFLSQMTEIINTH